MSVNLLAEFKEAVGGDFAEKVGDFLSVPTERTAQLLGDVIPATLAAIIKKAEGSIGTQSIADFIKTHRLESHMVESVATHFESIKKTNQLQNLGNTVINFLFNRSSGILDDLVDAAVGHSGGSRTATTSLFKLVGPLLMSLIGSKIANQNLSPADLGKMLNDQKNVLKKEADSGILSKFDFQSEQQETSKEIESANTTRSEPAQVEQVENPSTGPSRLSRLVPWFILVSTATLLWYVMHSCGGLPRDEDGNVIDQLGGEPTTQSVPSTAQAKNADAQPTSQRTVEKGVVKITLPNGASLETAENSVIDQMHQYLNVPGFDPARRFMLNSANFRGDTLQESEDLQSDLEQLATLLDGYPNVHLRVESYTDNRGNANRNLTRTERRALSIKRALNGLGVSIERLRSAGLGENNPVGDNGTPEGREANHRIELVVTKK